MSTAVPPIVIDENGDLQIYPSVDMAAGELEAIDVLEGEYEAFDSLARPLQLGAQGERVFIHLMPDMSPNPSALRRRVLRALRSELEGSGEGEARNLRRMSLGELLDMLISIQRPADVRRGRIRRWFNF